MPKTSREFLRVAAQRLTTAEFLRESGNYNLDAKYLAGYGVECALKALILYLAPATKQTEILKKITSGKKMHDYEVLGSEVKSLGRPIPLTLVKKLRRYKWTTDLRYETGTLPAGETRGFLKTAKAIYDWVKGQLP